MALTFILLPRPRDICIPLLRDLGAWLRIGHTAYFLERSHLPFPAMLSQGGFGPSCNLRLAVSCFEDEILHNRKGLRPVMHRQKAHPAQKGFC